MKKYVELAIVVLIASVIGGVVAGLVGGNQSERLAGTRFPQGISADSTSPVAGEVRGTDLTITDDATISGGVLSVPTGAGATSTLTIGKIHLYATSSATQICLDFNTQATTTFGGLSNGSLGWRYGSCN